MKKKKTIKPKKEKGEVIVVNKKAIYISNSVLKKSKKEEELDKLFETFKEEVKKSKNWGKKDPKNYWKMHIVKG